MSLLAARASPSSETHMVVKAMSEFTSLPTFPVPRPPRWNVARPRESNRGATRATWSGVAPDDEDQLAVAGADRSAGEGGLDEMAASGFQTSADVAHRRRRVGGEIDQQRARLPRRSATPRTPRP